MIHQSINIKQNPLKNNIKKQNKYLETLSHCHVDQAPRVIHSSLFSFAFIIQPLLRLIKQKTFSVS